MASASTIEIQGRQLRVSNLDKVLYPAAGFTKGQVLDYYIRIAPFLLPHLKGRPVTMKRYPDGVGGEYFYEKNAPAHRPEWVKTTPVYSRHNQRDIQFLVIDDLPTLVWVANLASLELHPQLARAEEITRPTMLVFDLDPGPPAGMLECVEVALKLRKVFEHYGLVSCAKTSGSKGMQVYVPLNTEVTYAQTKLFAHALAQLLEQEYPELVVSDMKKSVREGRVLVDWSQNDEHKTTVSAYSLRAKDRPTVSTPVTWAEVEKAKKKKDGGLLRFEAGGVVKRAEKFGDLFGEVLTAKQKLPNAAGTAAKAAPAGKRRKL